MFHASNVLLQQQYRERRFIKYSKLISYLLVAEQNNELLMRNHQSHQLDLNHSLKEMQYRPKLVDVDVDEDEDMVVEEIPDTMVLIVIILRK